MEYLKNTNTCLIGLCYSSLASSELGTEKAFREKSDYIHLFNSTRKCCDYLKYSHNEEEIEINYNYKNEQNNDKIEQDNVNHTDINDILNDENNLTENNNDSNA
ncbi:hypothetical protein H8356DRAFT_1348169 [Neocallimastix lanati (nom. inval.)]|nr:hypothetical protein H8356DRAFT_1348169 [Neocallimastix sp. JGI-2020a]